MTTAPEPSWTVPFTGLSPRRFTKPVSALRRTEVDATRRGRPWSPPPADRAPLVTAYWRTDLTMRQLAPLGTPPTTRSSSTPTPAGSSWSDGPFAGNRNDCKAWEQSGAEDAVAKTMTIADGGHPGSGLVRIAP